MSSEAVSSSDAATGLLSEPVIPNIEASRRQLSESSGRLWSCPLFLICSMLIGATLPGLADAAKPIQTLTWNLSKPTEDIRPKKQIWHRLRNGFELELNAKNPAVRKQLQYLTAKRNNIPEVERWLDRVHPFIHYVVEELDRRDMPLELALLPVVESQYDPFALSGSKAAGMWQFIPSTAKLYNLRGDWWYSGSRDMRASTGAALRYLRDLHEDAEGDWLKALAGYNYGWRRVNRAVENNRRRSLPVTFWRLEGLPKETQEYVPRLIALVEIIKHPEKYGVNLPTVPNRPYFEVVDVGYQIDLPKAAELASMSLDEMYYLNAGFRRWATPPQGPHELLVLAETESDFREALKSLKFEERFNWTMHRVKEGDTLSGLARHYNTSLSALLKLNAFGTGRDRIYPGQHLFIPSAMLDYKFRSASKTGVGQVMYTVTKGDSLWRIANNHGINPYGQIRTWNDIRPGSSLHPGQKLLLWVPGKPTLVRQRRPVIRRMFYRVRRGDSLSKIAKHFGLSIHDVASWNSRSIKSVLQIGAPLTLYVDIDHHYQSSER